MENSSKKAHVKNYTGSEGSGFTGNEITSKFDHTAQVILSKNDIRGDMEFYLSEESANEIMHKRIGQDGLYRAKYEAHAKDGEYYILIGTDNDLGEFKNHSSLYKKGSDGAFFPYSFKHRAWMTDDCFSMACRMMEESAAATELLDGITWRAGCFPQQLNPHFSIRVISGNENLIKLGDLLGINAFLTSIGPGWIYPTCDPEDFMAALVPGNPRLFGSMIFYDKEGYHLCQFVTSNDILWYKGMGSGLELALKNDVYKTKDINKIRDVATFLWEDNILFKDKFNFPLSDQAYAEAYDLCGPYWVKKKKERPLSTAEFNSMQTLAWNIKESV